MVLARSLAPEALGVWALALAVQGYALHLGEMGLRSVVTAEAGRQCGSMARLLRRYLALRLGISGLVLAIVTAGAWAIVPGHAAIVSLAAASIVAAALQLDWMALADDRPAVAAALLLARPLVFLVALLLWPRPLTPAAVAILFLAAWLAAAALSWLALRRDSSGPAEPAPTGMLRRGAPLCAVTVLNQALLSGDLLLAGAMIGPAAAGHYYVASQVATSGLMLANAAGQAALARLGRHADDAGGFAAALRQEARAVVGCGLVLTAAILLLAPWLLPLLFGPAQAPAAPLLVALLPWFLLQHPTTLMQGALAAVGCGDRVLRANLVMLAALGPALLLAALSGSLVLLALARGLGEAARLAALLAALPQATRSLALRPRPAA